MWIACLTRFPRLNRYWNRLSNCFCLCREQKLQTMEEKRIERMGDSLKTFADVDRQILPIIGKCLDEMTQSAESIDSKTVSDTHTQSINLERVLSLAPPGARTEPFRTGSLRKEAICSQLPSV